MNSPEFDSISEKKESEKSTTSQTNKEKKSVNKYKRLATWISTIFLSVFFGYTLASFYSYNELSTFNYYNINDLKSDKPIILVIKNNGQTNNIYKKLILFDGFNMNNINTYLEGENNEN